MTADTKSELQKISKEFTGAIKDFRKKEFKKSLESFTSIIDKYEKSESPEILEIRRRAVSFANICSDQSGTKKSWAKDEDELINDIVYYLNSEDIPEAEKIITSYSKKGPETPFFLYLKSLFYLKKEDPSKALDYLEKCVKKDDDFKILAYNEPDFEVLHEDERFNSIVE